MDTEPTNEHYCSTRLDTPDSMSPERRQSIASTAYSSTVSSSSPDLTTDTVITPESDEDESSSVVPKVEEIEEHSLDEIEESKPVVADQITLPSRRKRGRPRKHPIVEQKRIAHARSKTGCGTCTYTAGKPLLALELGSSQC